jgi:alkanesulfonate monooxygenase SsuD/methylene tetrahydromethanopterin reductase-like flavin-dependent oxidoreductase (luciferase family)
MQQIQFGWSIPIFPTVKTDGSLFVEQIYHTLEQVQESFHSAWVADHFISWRDKPNLPALEGWTTICYLASAFPQLRFGNLVLAQSYRNPALLAKMASTLQLLTRGRFILGIGAGYHEEEYRAYGYDYPKPAVRVRQLEEAVQIILRLWTEPQATFDGKYYQIKDAICEPKPSPRPLIMIGGGGEQLLLRVAAQYADWWNITSTDPALYSHKLNVLRSHCDAIDRDYDEITKTMFGMVAIGRTEAEARRTSAMWPYPRFLTFVGTAEQVEDKLQSYISLGVQHFMLSFADFPDPSGAIRFTEEVIPRFR